MDKKCMLLETLNSTKILETKNEGGKIVLEGVFGVCGVKNNNQRIYQEANYNNMITEMQSRIKKDGGIPGELEHPTSPTMNIDNNNISHKITEVCMENGVVKGKIELLNTVKGKNAQAIVEGGLPLYISSRASGSVDGDKVTLDYLSTYDLVGSPGFSEAELHLTENQTYESINESCVMFIENVNEDVKKIKNNKEDMNKDILEKFEKLQSEINEVKAENKTLKENLNIFENWTKTDFVSGVNKWVSETYTNAIQEWINTDIRKSMIEENQNFLISAIAPTIQEWATKDLANEILESVQEWATKDLANEILESVQEWSSKDLANEILESVDEWVSKDVLENLKENKKKDSLQAIDEALNNFKVKVETKPSFKPTNIELNEANYIKNMPMKFIPLWESADEQTKKYISTRAKLYNFIDENSISNFWESCDFTMKHNGLIIENQVKNLDPKFESLRKQLQKFKH